MGDRRTSGQANMWLQRVYSRLIGAGMYFLAGTFTADRTRTLQDVTGNEVVDSWPNVFTVDQTFNSGTASTSTTTGAAKVNGGLGVTGDVWIGGYFAATLSYLTTASTATYAIDCARGQLFGAITALAANCTISTTNLAAGRIFNLLIKDNGTTRTLTFPGSWNWKTTPPTGTTVGKWLDIVIKCTDGTDAGVIADWSVTL